MAHPDSSLPAPVAGRHLFAWGDFAFLCVLIAALAGVVYSGRFAYREGMALETAKANAAAFVQWTQAVAATGADGSDVPMTLALCSVMPGAPAVDSQGPSTRAMPAAAEAGAGSGPTSADPAEAPPLPQVATSWATCREALFTAGGPLSHLSNPFLTSNPVSGNKCEKGNPGTRGLVVLEKGTPAPPGLPPGVSWSPLEDGEPMARGLMLRVKVCDAGGYLIRVAEVQL